MYSAVSAAVSGLRIDISGWTEDIPWTTPGIQPTNVRKMLILQKWSCHAGEHGGFEAAQKVSSAAAF
jgi:hypothetical protein